MDSDFRSGRKTKIIEPLNDLTAPKVPDFSEIPDDNDPLVLDTSDEMASETTVATGPTPVEAKPDATTPDKSPPASFWNFHWPHNKRLTIIIAVVVVLLLGGGTAAAWLAQPRGQGGTFVSEKPEYTPPKPTTVASVLSGVQVNPTVNNRPVVGIMIENSTDARPQSGLDQADVVFEAIAEGGITRFMALFHDHTPDYIGPVRSARPYYVQWCMSFDCAYVHAGGSPEALQNIANWRTKDLNHNTTAFWRVSSRYAPHNLYTSISKLHVYASSKGYGAASFTSLTRKDDSVSQAPTARSIDTAISSAKFNSHYDYDVASNSYTRSQAGAAHTVIDSAGKSTALKPKVVVAMIMSYGVAADKHSQYGVVGSGEVYVFQDGNVTKGTWSKANHAAALQLTGVDGAPLKLNAGQTWFVALSGANKLTYK